MQTINWKYDNEPKMKVNQRKGVIYLTYPSIEEIGNVIHGFTTRIGGVSEGEWATMNLSFTRGDDGAAVRENYHRVASAMGFAYESIVTSDQTHTTNVIPVTKRDRGKGITCQRDYQEVDGLITNEPGVTLATFYADCVPLFFVDKEHRAIGLSHSGWRGTVGKIGKVTVEHMTREYGTNPEDVVAAIGPSICRDCYEVSEDVAEEFYRVFPEEIHKKILYPKGNQKYQLDLWEANIWVLQEAGIQRKYISLPNLCTCCNPNLLYSHRASKGRRGNLGAFISICK